VDKPQLVAYLEAAAKRLPAPFRDDPLVRDNLANLESDMEMWNKES